MRSLTILSPVDMALEIAARLKNRRLAQQLTQEGLARRSGVPLGTLKKFECSGRIAFASFIRLAIALKDEGALNNLLLEEKFASLDELLERDKRPQRGRIK
ncbi:hypothetical protein MNBD_GAMMA26-371 [hydrothermal vent metagenome]|uniref:HTH cro/C1-type domain-containing protein n=1 Tax=hydrothermal vent metagenome TaxID=652676 RepID=A0A3B1BCZ3_9ZZZZ